MLGVGLALPDTAVRIRGGAGLPPAPSAIVIEGDSITAFTNPDSYARLWTAERSALDISNFAVGGSQLTDLQQRSAAALAEQPGLLYVLIGANDLPSDTNAYLAQLWAYTDQFRGPACRVIAGTVLPRTNAANWTAKRTAFNAALRSAVGVKIDDVVDFDTNPMGLTGTENDAVKYPDGLHPSAAGHALLKRTFAPVMNHWLGIANEPLDFAFAPQNAATADTDYDGAPYTVTGLYAGESRPYACTGGKVRKNNGAFVTDGSGTVVNGDTLTPRNHASADPATRTDVTLTIGATDAIYSVTTAGAGTRDWVPTDLGAKLKLWLKPENIAEANAVQIDSWPDASGNAVAVTGAGTSSKPTAFAAGPNGFKTARFDGPLQSRFTLPAAYLSGRTGMASFAVTKLAGDPPSAHFGPPFASWGSDGSGEFFPYVNGALYSNYGSNARHQTPDPAPSLAAWRLVSFHAATNDWRCYIDGAALLTLTANVFATGGSPVIGYDVNGGGAFDGQIAEIVDCAAALTTTERQLVEGYLAWKYGLQANLPAGHPYEDERPTI